MHTKDFIAQVEALPFVGELEKGFNTLGFPSPKTGASLFSVREDVFLSVDMDYPPFRKLQDEEKSQLMTIVWQYISTPVDEREPEKRFELKPKSEFKTLFGDDKLRLPIFGGIIIRFTNSKLKDLFTEQQLHWIEMTFDKEWIDE